MAARDRTRDGGFVTSVELLYLLVLALVAVAFIAFVGRLHAAGVSVAAVSQSAARAASLAPDPGAGAAAAAAAVASSALAERCTGASVADLSWQASPSGSWQGGSVTVRVTCTVRNAELTGVWTPGTRRISVADTQPIDRYQR